MKWVPLRVHSVFSQGQGGILGTELALWARRQKLQAVPLTDVANLYGWSKWKEITSQEGIRPVFGCELSLEGKTFVFLVKNREGYWNLMEILNSRTLRPPVGLVTIVFPWSEDPQSWKGEPLLEEVAPDDVYLGADWTNIPRALAWGRYLGRPVVWANPLKFVEHPYRLVLLAAIHRFSPRMATPGKINFSRRTGAGSIGWEKVGRGS